MNILVDHGSAHNYGDTSMFEAVTEKLRTLLPDTTLHVIDRPRMETDIWELDGIVRHPPYRFSEPLAFANGSPTRRVLLKNLSRLGHYVFRHGTAARGFPLELPGWVIDPGRIELRRPEFARSMNEYCRPFDGLHIAGGGTLTDVFDWGLIQRSALIRTFANQSKPVVLTGQQIGPFSSVHSRLLTARALREADYIGLREPTASRAFCEQAGIPLCAVTGDDSFGLPSDKKEARRHLSQHGLVPEQFIAINVRLGYYVPEHEQHVAKIADLIRSLTDQLDLPALVVPIAFGGKKSDIESGYRLQEEIGDRVKVLDDPKLTASAVKGVMGLAYGGVGISYHFCTFALSQGVPAVCIHDGAYYGQKAEGLAAFWDEERINLPLNNMEVEKGVEQILSVWKNPALRHRLSRRAEEAIAMWEAAFEQDVAPALHATVIQ